MQCSCGSSSFTSHEVSEKKKIIGKYIACKACGRVEWEYGRKEVLALEKRKEAEKEAKALKSDQSDRLID